jgi:hypothetical protein
VLIGPLRFDSRQSGCPEAATIQMVRYAMQIGADAIAREDDVPAGLR